jgi:penicillin-binding protein 1A
VIQLLSKRFIKTALKIFILLILVLIPVYYFLFPQVSALPSLVQSNIKSHDTLYVPLSQMPDSLQKAIIDTEDQSFYSIPGISFKGIGRSIIIDVVNRKFQEGASTITQQLARQYYLSQEKTISRKLKEATIALMVTKTFTKDEILEMYLNSVYFGHGAWGIDAASKIYFNKTVSELTTAQCTLLAGLPQAPSYLDPFINYQAARDRQLQVLEAMVDAGDLNQYNIQEIIAMPLDLK